MVRITVLGQVAATVGGRPADLGGPRQRAVLARLLAARGHVVSVDRIVDDLWHGEPPPRAQGGLQAYVSNLRRALEPGRGPRTPATVLVSAAPGYAVHLADPAVDAWRFEALLAAARDASAARARGLLAEALGLWHGAAFGEFAAEPWAQPEVARLDELRLVARERLADALIGTGAAPEAAVEAEGLTREHPMREEAWRLLALAHYAAGRQADALAALRTARAVLADELGIDPGPALVELEAAVLAQQVPLPRPEATGGPTAPASGPVSGPASAPASGPVSGPASAPASGPDQGGDRAAGDGGPAGFVGRADELATLLAAAGSATPTTPAVALLTAEAGGGKSALLDRLRAELTGTGWLVTVGRCPETEGAPSAWAWVEALRAVAAGRPQAPAPADLAPLLGGDHLDGTGGDALTDRFRLHRAVAGWLAADPDLQLAVLLDDLHVADAETLALLRSVLELWPGGARLLVVAAYRPAEGGPALDEALGALARYSPARVRLRGLPEGEAARLVTAVCGRTPDPGTLAALHERTGGNPFYLRESARLLAGEGVLVATSEVPEGVRDVLRRRFSRLPEVAVAVLRTASVLGRDVDVDVLLAAVETDEDTALDALDAGVVAGLLVEPEPGRLRFAHALVQETLYQGIPALRRRRWHGRVVDAVSRVRPDDVSALAHHYRFCVTPETAGRALEVTVAAADRARARFGWDAEAALLGQAVDLLDRLPAGSARGGPEDRVGLLARLARARFDAGASIEGVQARTQTLRAAADSGRDDLLVAAIRTTTVPLPWLVRRYGTTDTRLVGELQRLLAAHPLTDADRCWLLCVLTQETAGNGDGVAAAAAGTALELATGLDDPGLLCFALLARGEVLAGTQPDRLGERADELLATARAHDLAGFEVLALHVACRDAFVRNRPDDVERLLDELDTVHRRHQLGQSADSVLVSRGALAHARGDFARARALWGQAVDSMRRRGAQDADGIAVLGAVSFVQSEGSSLAGLVPVVQAMAAGFGPIVNDTLALALVDAGRTDEARAVRAGNLPLRDDFFWLTMAPLRARAAAAVGEPDEVAAMAEALAPFDGLIAGCVTAAFVGPPVAEALALCHQALGDPAEAARCWQRAEQVALAWGNGVWAGRAARAGRALDAAAGGGPSRPQVAP